VDWKDVDEATDYQLRAVKVAYVLRTFRWASNERTVMKIAVFLGVTRESKQKRSLSHSSEILMYVGHFCHHFS
jgi:hypothetical protein